MSCTQEQARHEGDFFYAHDFSLVLGGPTFHFFRRLHLTSDELGLRWRVLTIIMVTWLPLLLLATFNYSAVAGLLSFLRDIEVHVRFLVALPVLIAAELLVHLRVRFAVRCFVERGIVVPQDLPRFDRAIQSAIRLRDSSPIEIGLLILVYTLGLRFWLWQHRAFPDVSTWYFLPGETSHLTPAGFWYAFVSMPIFQFVFLRWYMRLFIWFRFLWHVSKINLNIIPTHPDRCAGLGFLGRSAYAFGPVLFAQGSLLSALVASRVLYTGESLLSFKLQVEVVGFIGFFVLAILGPLVMFTPAMARARRKGLADYGLFAQRYVETFEQKWIIHSHGSTEKLLGSPDIQSLADLGHSYALVREMRVVPFGLDDITRLAAATAVPLLPLLLTIFSPEELITRVVKFVWP
jgi:hypothetical protein